MEVLYVICYGTSKANLGGHLTRAGYKYVNVSEALLWKSGFAICVDKKAFTDFKTKLGDVDFLFWNESHEEAMQLIPDEAKLEYILSTIRSYVPDPNLVIRRRKLRFD